MAISSCLSGILFTIGLIFSLAFQPPLLSAETIFFLFFKEGGGGVEG